MTSGNDETLQDRLIETMREWTLASGRLDGAQQAAGAESTEERADVIARLVSEAEQAREAYQAVNREVDAYKLRRLSEMGFGAN
jgi:hypothetical protein